MDEPKIHYYGFVPSPSARSTVREKIGQLDDLSPSLSEIKLTIHKNDEIFRGLIHVNSSEGKFSATSSSRDVVTLATELYAQIEQQYKRWKTGRFDGEAGHHL